MAGVGKKFKGFALNDRTPTNFYNRKIKSLVSKPPMRCILSKIKQWQARQLNRGV